MADLDMMQEELKDLRTAVEHAEAKASRAEERADQAAAVAMSSLEGQKHFHAALEHAHAQMGEMLAAQKKMMGVVEVLAKAALAPK